MSVRVEEVRDIVADAIGKPCWGVLVSKQGDTVVVDLGEKLRRAIRLSNPHLSFIQRTYEGEVSFLIECPWRLEGPEGVITTSIEDERDSETRPRKLTNIEGRILGRVAIENRGMDLVLAFDGGYELRVFSAVTDKRKSNWTFTSPEYRVTIGPHGRAEIESRRVLEKRFTALKRAIQGEPDDPVAKFLLARGRANDDEPAEVRALETRAPGKLIPIAPDKSEPPKRRGKKAKKINPKKSKKKNRR